LGVATPLLTRLSPGSERMCDKPLSYKETDTNCGSQVGPIKSRVNRAQPQLVGPLGHDEPDDLRPDRVTKTALQPDD
jgi:hypothetical protein